MDKYRDALAGMFGDKRFREARPYCYVGTVDGERWGVVLASKNVRKFSNYALGTANVDDLIAGKRSGKYHRAFIVGADVDGFNIPTFVEAHDAEELHANLLSKIRPRAGNFGNQFWTLTRSMIASGTLDADEEAF